MNNPETLFSAITIFLERPNLGIFSLSCVCSTCNHVMSLTLERGEDGTFQLISPGDNSHPLGLFSSKPFLAATEKGKLLISCARCRSGVTRIHVSSGTAGILFSPVRFPHAIRSRTRTPDAFDRHECTCGIVVYSEAAYRTHLEDVERYDNQCEHPNDVR